MKKPYTLALPILLLLSINNSAMAFERGGERPPPRPEFSSLDTNEDGQIEWDEFATQEVPHGTADEVFQNMDTNEDGFLSEEEYSAHKPKRPRRD